MNRHRASFTNASRGLLSAVDCASIRRSSTSDISSSAELSKVTAGLATTMTNKSSYEVVEKGNLYDLNYRVFIKGPHGFVSPWHDIPLYADKKKGVYNMIVEIPRWSNAKMEMATDEPLTPIKQDKKGGKPRFVHNIFPHHGYIWNYGALPQTWEDPDHTDPNTAAKGDNDPIDVVEIGSKVQPRGSVVRVKVIGVLGLLDDGETDWKLVALCVDDPLAGQVNNLNDVDKHFPGLLTATHEWFRLYKIPAGKKANTFAFGGEFKDVDFARSVIDETHAAWKKLIVAEKPALNTESHYEGATHPADDEKWTAAVKSHSPAGDAASTPAELDKWHFVSA